MCNRPLTSVASAGEPGVDVAVALPAGPPGGWAADSPPGPASRAGGSVLPQAKEDSRGQPVP